MVRIRDTDGMVGTGYSYTIGTGGSSVARLLDDHLAPMLIGREADDIEKLWRDLFFRVHATTVGALTSIALAAIDTALWDLRARRAALPLHRLAGGAKDGIEMYYTEGGWLHLDEAQLVDEAVRAQEAGFGGTKIKVGRPQRGRGHGTRCRRCATPSAPAGSHDRRQPGPRPERKRSAARAASKHWTSPGSRSPSTPTTSTPIAA